MNNLTAIHTAQYYQKQEKESFGKISGMAELVKSRFFADVMNR